MQTHHVNIATLRIMPMRKVLFAAIFLPTLAFTQDFGDYIEKNAIEIKTPDSLNEEIYNIIQGFQLIMVGEMHGTQEPALLVSGLSELIVKYEGNVSVGLELPRDEMGLFISSPSDSSLLYSEFFSKKNIDGRNGKSWFDLILRCNSNPSINLFYFDNYESDQLANRDSTMYRWVVKQSIKYPDSKIITLSGNIHNWLLPFRGTPKMGYYCFE